MYRSELLAQTTVFRSGTEGYASFRIPAILQAPNGNLLAFCEGRVKHAGDFGNIDLVFKRSTDQGKTWSSLQVLVDAGSLQAGNPAPVVDKLDPRFPKGRIFLFYNTGNNHEGEVRKGKGQRQVWYIVSTDNGSNWSAPVNITTQVHRTQQPADWRSYANTPGHALQLSKGKFKGRIYVAANHSAGDPKPRFEDYQAHGFFTDDHGEHFQLSESVHLLGSNESTAAELSDDRLMLNSRNQKGDVRTRIVSISRDGGSRWDSIYFDKQLPDPVCEGSLLNIGWKKGKAVLAFCNPASTNKRDSLTLRISYNEGHTWDRSILVDPTPGSGDNQAYCDLVYMKKKTIGILYERNGYNEIVFHHRKIR
ncbi:MAG: exo-alpha-sialidase [Bacteroidota bacterium]